MIWFTSDLHFHHKRICEYANRPFSSVEEMNEQLIINWNAVVLPSDTVWSLGDFSFGKLGQTIEVLSRLNGEHSCVFGNHDKVLVDNKEQLLNSGYFKEMVHYKELSYRGQFICLFHYGQRVFNKSHYGSWQLFGHSHNSLEPFGKSVDVGVDSTYILNGVTEYRPFSFDEIKTFMDARKPAILDHHKMRNS